MKRFIKGLIFCGVLSCILAAAPLASTRGNGGTAEKSIDKVIAEMTLDEKISQMIIPAMRTWNGVNVTDLDAAAELKAALQRHQYGGIILFATNISGNEQITRLLYALQENNAQIGGVSTHIPYLTPVDEEGGIVIRLSSGTRMTGNMAIGATAYGAANAETTGALIGEELAAVGFNTDFAPVIDVNSNPANPVIGTRSFSDDPGMVSELGIGYARGLAKNNVISCYKHFPGHGDTVVDSHIGTPSVEKTYAEISAMELVPFKAAIENGADMIMTAHITYPKIDEEVTFADGTTKGYYPATMSRKMITDILRTDLGFNGVVVTDALGMDAIRTAGLVPGDTDSVEYSVNIAEKIINAGVDILLLPVDINGMQKVKFCDDYISGIAAKIASGEISEKRIDESVKRILMLKSAYGIFDVSGSTGTAGDLEAMVKNSNEVVGSEAHHAAEMDMARKAITLVKNDQHILPLSGEKKSIVVLGRLKDDKTTLDYALDEMKKKGLIGENTEVTIDYYSAPSAENKLHYTAGMKEKIRTADAVIGFSYASGGSVLNKQNEQFIALHSAMEDVHSGGGSFILVSGNLPYDAAVFQEADAIVLAYMGAGLGIDPTEKLSNAGQSAINANIIAAVETVFGCSRPEGKVPVNIPVVTEDAAGNLSYGTEYLYRRGFGLGYQ